MKFISKQTNYLVVLKHGQPSEPITGRNAVPGSYVRFEDGMVNIDDEETCKLMMNHKAFNSDFVLADKDKEDPWEDSRRESEPDHTITKIEYGHVGKSTGKPVSTLTHEQKIEVKKIAEKMAAEIAPKMAMEMLEKLAKEKEEKVDIEGRYRKDYNKKKTTTDKKEKK